MQFSSLNINWDISMVIDIAVVHSFLLFKDIPWMNTVKLHSCVSTNLYPH